MLQTQTYEALDDAIDPKAPVESILEEVVDAGEGEQVAIGDLINGLPGHAFGPALLLVSLIAVIPPLGAIPGVPTAVAICSFLIAGQLLLGRDGIWLPDFIERRDFKRRHLEKVKSKVLPWMSKLDAVLKPRLLWAVTGHARRCAGLLAMCLAVLMVPLEVLPFMAALPAFGIGMVGLALTTRDGLLMLNAAALLTLCLYLLLTRVVF